MVLQIDKPKDGDPFFNNGRGKYFGISTCITGSPTDPGCNVLANCVGGAVGAYNKAACEDIENPKWGPILYPPNAENIYKYAQDLGIPTSKTPEAGALVIWRKGATLNSSDGAGHVAFVYKVEANGDILTAESEYKGRAWVNRKYTKASGYSYADGYTFIGFVLQPRKAVPGGYIKYGDTGSAVVWLQEHLKAAAKDNAMFDPGNVDGDFGGKTERALVYFQYKNGLAVDGVAGPATQAALAK
jgi:hypothetical protein